MGPPGISPEGIEELEDRLNLLDAELHEVDRTQKNRGIKQRLDSAEANIAGHERQLARLERLVAALERTHGLKHEEDCATCTGAGMDGGCPECGRVPLLPPPRPGDIPPPPTVDRASGAEWVTMSEYVRLRDHATPEELGKRRAEKAEATLARAEREAERTQFTMELLRKALSEAKEEKLALHHSIDGLRGQLERISKQAEEYRQAIIQEIASAGAPSLGPETVAGVRRGILNRLQKVLRA